jgi:hypothetical protein
MKCFDYHRDNNIKCDKSECRYWVNCSEAQMCCINLISKKDNFTLEDVGKVFDITRMRICQIEKKAIEKLKIYTKRMIK